MPWRGLICTRDLEIEIVFLCILHFWVFISPAVGPGARWACWAGSWILAWNDSKHTEFYEIIWKRTHMVIPWWQFRADIFNGNLMHENNVERGGEPFCGFWGGGNSWKWPSPQILSRSGFRGVWRKPYIRSRICADMREDKWNTYFPCWYSWCLLALAAFFVICASKLSRAAYAQPYAGPLFDKSFHSPSSGSIPWLIKSAPPERSDKSPSPAANQWIMGWFIFGQNEAFHFHEAVKMHPVHSRSWKYVKKYVFSRQLKTTNRCCCCLPRVFLYRDPS